MEEWEHNRTQQIRWEVPQSTEVPVSNHSKRTASRSWDVSQSSRRMMRGVESSLNYSAWQIRRSKIGLMRSRDMIFLTILIYLHLKLRHLNNLRSSLLTHRHNKHSLHRSASFQMLSLVLISDKECNLRLNRNKCKLQASIFSVTKMILSLTSVVDPQL